MRFSEVETLVLARESICTKIRAVRISEIRRTVNLIGLREDVTTRDAKRLRKNFEEMERQIYTAHLQKAQFDALLDVIEGDLELFTDQILK